MITWLLAFLMTQGVELPLYKRFAAIGLGRAFTLSAVTHPIVWFGFFHPSLPLARTERVVVAETFAWFVEAALLSRWMGPGWRRAPLISLLANAASYGTGWLSARFFAFP